MDRVVDAAGRHRTQFTASQLGKTRTQLAITHRRTAFFTRNQG